AVGEVSVRQQDLRAVQPVAAERAFVALREPHLPHRGRRLELVHGVRAPRPAQALHALGDGAARDDDDAPAQAPQRRDLLGPARDGAGVEAAALVRDQRGTDLDDEGARLLQAHLSALIFASSRATARHACSVPWARMADTLNHGRFQRNCARTLRMRWSGSSTASALLNTSHLGFAASACSYFFSSAAMTRTSPAGSSALRSTMCNSSLVRARWRRNWWPRPAPSEAPSISPGMSATTKLASPTRTTPSDGLSVVKG